MRNLEVLFKPRTMAVIGISTTNDRHPANVIYNKNLQELSRLIMIFSGLVMEMEDLIDSIDLNPVMCNKEKCVIADARIMLKEKHVL